MIHDRYLLALGLSAAFIALPASDLFAAWNTCSQFFHLASLMLFRQALLHLDASSLASVEDWLRQLSCLTLARSSFSLIISGVHHRCDFGELRDQGTKQFMVSVKVWLMSSALLSVAAFVVQLSLERLRNRKARLNTSQLVLRCKCLPVYSIWPVFH